jgi:hypothetical protein
VAVAEANGGEVRYFGEIANTPQAVEKPVSHLKGKAALSYRFAMRQAPAATASTVN